MSFNDGKRFNTFTAIRIIDELKRQGYSHSIVPGGLLVIS